MRRFVFTVIAAILLLVLAGCSGEYHPKQLEVYADNGEAPAYLDDLQLPEVRPGQADFYEELREHGSLITAAFDFDEFSVWFAITPGYVYSQHLGVYEWNILHPTRPTIAAVVRNEGDRYVLVEEVETDLAFDTIQAGHWSWTDEPPNVFSPISSQHLTQRDGYLVGDLRSDVFSGRAVTTLTDNQMILVYGDWDTRLVRQLRFTKDGVLSDHTLEDASRMAQIFFLSSIPGPGVNLTLSQQTGALTMENRVYRLHADADGITETILRPAEFEPLVDGTLTRIIIDELVGLSPEEDMLDSFWLLFRGAEIIPTNLRFPIINGRMYHIPWIPRTDQPRAELRLNSFDLATGEHIYDQLIHDFSPEVVLYRSFAVRGLTVYTDVAAYLFDHSFELVHRVPWPEYIPAEHIEHRWVLPSRFNDSFTRLAYAATFNDIHGIYLFDLNAGTPPVLFKEQAPIDTSKWEGWPEDFMEWPGPVLLLDDERMLVSVGFWEGIELFRLIDLEGNVLEEFPFHVSDSGFVFTSTAMVIFEPGHTHGPHYFDFAEGVLHPADWWGRGENERWNSFIPDPNNPRVWYVSNHWWSVEQRGYVGIVTEHHSSIMRVDFESKTLEPLLLATDATITLMSVGQDGEFVFAYTDLLRSGGFAVFTAQ